MYLEYWMIGILLGFFYLGMRYMHYIGYKEGFVEGGIHGHLITMKEMQQRIDEAIKKSACNEKSDVL